MDDGRSGQVPPWWTDPTKNVESLVSAATRRQDDLRDSEAAHVRELMRLRSEYESRLSDGEAKRIDAIRAVDVGAAAILANQVAASAEALRGQVEAARQQTALALAAALEPIQKDIQDLRRAQYEAQGQHNQTGESRLNSGVMLQLFALLVAVASIIAIVVIHH